MNDNKLCAVVRDCLDTEEQALSHRTQSRLNQIRFNALDKKQGNRLSFLDSLIPSPRIAAASVTAVFVAVTAFYAVDFSMDKSADQDFASNSLIEDEPIYPDAVDDSVGEEFFLTEEDLDFFENIDLYQWLDSEFKIS